MGKSVVIFEYKPKGKTVMTILRKRRLDGFDTFVMAGGLVNVIIILILIGYWLLH